MGGGGGLISNGIEKIMVNLGFPLPNYLIHPQRHHLSHPFQGGTPHLLQTLIVFLNCI